MTTDTRKLFSSGIELNEGINNRCVSKAQMTMKMPSCIRAVTAQSIFFFYSDAGSKGPLVLFILSVCLR